MDCDTGARSSLVYLVNNTVDCDVGSEVCFESARCTAAFRNLNYSFRSTGIAKFLSAEVTKFSPSSIAGVKIPLAHISYYLWRSPSLWCQLVFMGFKYSLFTNSTIYEFGIREVLVFRISTLPDSVNKTVYIT
jgi:hypothetical protein